MNVSACITEIDAITNKFKSRFGSLNLMELNLKPSLSTWSIGQNIEHLIHITDSYSTTFDNIINETHKLPGIAKLPFWAKMCGKMILKSVEPSREKKIKTFAIWEPSMSDVPESIIESFTSNQASFKKTIKALSASLNQNIIIASPANKNIVYSLDAALEIIIEHQKRHYNQASEIFDSLKIHEDKI